MKKKENRTISKWAVPTHFGPSEHSPARPSCKTPRADQRALHVSHTRTRGLSSLPLPCGVLAPETVGEVLCFFPAEIMRAQRNTEIPGSYGGGRTLRTARCLTRRYTPLLSIK
jgi:hypothetical protein